MYVLHCKAIGILVFVFTFPEVRAQLILPDYQLTGPGDPVQLFHDDDTYPLVKFPAGYEQQAKIALSYYPELKGLKIRFRTKKGGAPFVSRPTVGSTFFKKPENRTYLIIIRTGEDKRFGPILMKNMPLNAQIGVLGHELAHTVDFAQRGLGKMMRVIWGNLSKKYMDEFEYNTDRSAIEHGLGFQILAWSRHASKTLRFNEPENPEANKKIAGIFQRERYMLPATIIKTMRELPLYEPHWPQLEQLVKD
ncbi:hypothetical protein QQ020_08485 [Fulvivirgaceae bacterium BMA12]|uniref:Uncharacterized protein n=1 Tax=Agaribacillus aureus TaxID=3051825 RepID=A0ABT8L4B0_9BACT|nr:hypothetical protein [Fulvivirgaceae bacterium BMA12]